MAARKKTLTAPAEGAGREDVLPATRRREAVRGIARTFKLDPNEVTSIVCGNKVVYIDRGALSVEIKSAR